MWAGVISAIALAVCGCSSETRLPDEQNPFYKHGLKLRDESKYSEAAEAFEKCLRMNPESQKAHLQLATLYEDHLDDPLLAVLHYRSYLERAAGKDAAFAREWLVHAERTLASELAERHPQITEPGGLNQPAGGEVASAGHVSESERRLARRVKELNSRILVLEQQLATPSVVPSISTGDKLVASGNHAPAQAIRTHVVESGETLSSISTRYYGTPRLWRRLQQFNSGIIRTENLLLPGMKLQIPAAADLPE